MTVADVLDLVQSTLDSILSESGVRSYWGRRADDGQANPSEYVIYDVDRDEAEVSADGDLYYRTISVSLQYYVKYSGARTYTGRRTTNDRMETMREAMRSAGFGCPSGWYEIGDVDDIGFATFRADFELPHEVGEE